MPDADVQTLRLFLSMVDLRNLTHAAQRHNISPSAVTRRIRDLEALYDVTLFERRSRGVVPTAAGDELARHVRDLFSRLAFIKGTMGEFSLGARGQVRVGASASVLLHALVEAIVDFTGRHPLIRIDLAEMMSWAVVRDVVDGRTDIGVVAGSVEVPGDLSVHRYSQDRLLVLLPSGHPLGDRPALEFREVLDFEHVGIASTSAISVQLAEEAGRIHRVIRYAYRVSTFDVARWMVAKGCGLAIAPSSMLLPYAGLFGTCAVPLSDAWARRDMRICVRDEATLTIAGRLFLNHLRGTDPLTTR